MSSTPSTVTDELRIEKVRRMPKGAERDPSAQCYISAPGMRKGILAGMTLRPTQTKGGAPVLVAEVESDKSETDVAHALDPMGKRSYAHFNLPREDSIVEKKFDVIFINPTLFDKEVEVVMKAEAGENEREVIVCEGAFMDGNKLTVVAERPDMTKGFYKLVAKIRQKDGVFLADAETSIYVE